MTHRATLLATLAALAIAATCPALADTYYVTYTGTATGTDTYGVFGTGGAYLNGAAFTSTYTYNSALFSGAYYDSTSQVYGGTEYGAYNSPIVSATLAINGSIYSVNSSYFGNEFVSGGQFYSYAANGSQVYFRNYGNVSAGLPTQSLIASQAFALGFSGGYLDYFSETITLNDTYVSVTDGPPAVVPEPGSLALLGGGTVVLGLALGVQRAMSRKREAMPSSPDHRAMTS